MLDPRLLKKLPIVATCPRCRRLGRTFVEFATQPASLRRAQVLRQVTAQLRDHLAQAHPGPH